MRRFWRRARAIIGPMPGDEVILPGFGLMDDDFYERVHAIRPGGFYVQMGILTGWGKTSDLVQLGPHRWAHKEVAEAHR